MKNILPLGSSVWGPTEHNGDQNRLSSDIHDFHTPICYIRGAVNRKLFGRVERASRFRRLEFEAQLCHFQVMSPGAGIGLLNTEIVYFQSCGKNTSSHEVVVRI